MSRGRWCAVGYVSAPALRRAQGADSALGQEAHWAGSGEGSKRLRDQVIGTLNLFRSAPDGPDQPVARAARALVDVATIGILQERAFRQQELVAAQLQAALHSRVMIEQAKGVLAERHHVTPDQAFRTLRRYARDHNRPLTALAGDVIHGTTDISPGGQATTRPPPHDEPENSPGPGAASGPRS